MKQRNFREITIFYIKKFRHITAFKRHSPEAGAIQGYDRLHAERWKYV